MNSYQKEGYANRSEYLEALSYDFDVPLKDVMMFASKLGPNEDFDGLVNQVNNHANRLTLDNERMQYL